MLKVIVCRDGQPVSDFASCDFADATIRRYLCNGEDMEIKVANELVQDAFVLSVFEGKLSPDDIEFYWEDVRLSFDKCLGLIIPEGAEKVGLHYKMTDRILKLAYANMRAEKLAKKDAERSSE